MKLRILDEAGAEFADAIARYEAIESGLGVRLKQEVRAALEWIAGNAELPRANSHPVAKTATIPLDAQPAGISLMP